MIMGWDASKNEASEREVSEREKHKYYFGENVGILIFGQWWPNISQVGHQSYAPTYDFPIRLKFVDKQFAPEGLHTGNPEWRGWNLPNWIQAAQELEAEGVRSIVGGCGISGRIQIALADAVDIPVYSSTVMFIPEIYAQMDKDKKIGVLTVSSEVFHGWDDILLKECGVDESIPLVVAGMSESDYLDDWLSAVQEDFDPKKVEHSVVNTALQLVEENRDIGQLVFECTDMTPYTDAVRQATGLPVFDAVDMVKYAHEEASRDQH